MTFSGFTPHDFDTFSIEGLEGRMEAIQSRIQPKFREISEALLQELSVEAGEELHLHIAKHARRKVNAPVDTWMSFSSSKRGYKQLPHFQIGLFDDRVFLWLALIYELPNKANIARTYLNELDSVLSAVPADYMLSTDHMKKDADAFGDLGDEGVRRAVERFRDVKKAELLIGRNIPAGSPVLGSGEAFLDTARETFRTLMPLYQLAVRGAGTTSDELPVFS
ncbi:DUF1054 domain-containing protein [Paenibacillus caseinilyticus]|nr:DUF1054 domain-containing protein [Paenibacillus mucilaginosus]WFA20537.1 DUF1054 domain-containing protein [Paenibacillus mucilaginosus]